MDSYLQAHIRELSERAQNHNVVTATPFLDLPTIALLNRKIANGKFHGTPCLFFGGCSDFERARLVFLPDYLDQATFLAEEKESPSLVSCLRISPRGGSFAKALTHRDYLGALMALGIKRETLGDLRIEGNEARLYLLPEIRKTIEDELTSVGTEEVKIQAEPLFSPGFSLHFREEVLSLASLRLDAVLAQGFPFSRGQAEAQIEAGNVHHNGEIATRGDRLVGEGDVVSCRRQGKILLMGEEGHSRKGRMLIRIRRYL